MSLGGADGLKKLKGYDEIKAAGYDFEASPIVLESHKARFTSVNVTSIVCRRLVASVACNKAQRLEQRLEEIKAFEICSFSLPRQLLATTIATKVIAMVSLYPLYPPRLLTSPQDMR